MSDTNPHPPSSAPAATPAPAPTSPRLEPSLPLPEASPAFAHLLSLTNLSPHAAPFFPSSKGRSKHQRWQDSPVAHDDELPERRAPAPDLEGELPEGRAPGRDLSSERSERRAPGGPRTEMH